MAECREKALARHAVGKAGWAFATVIIVIWLFVIFWLIRLIWQIAF